MATYTCNVHMMRAADMQTKKHVVRALDYEEAIRRAESAHPEFRAYRVEMIGKDYFVLAYLKDGQWFTRGAVRK